MDPIEKEISILISAKYPIVYIVSREEDRVIESLKKVAGKLFKSIYSWNCVNGLSYKNKKFDNSSNPLGALACAEQVKSDENVIFVFKDLHSYMDNPQIVRQLKELGQSVVKSKKSCFIVSPVLKIPAELETDITVVDYPLPNIDYIKKIFDSLCKSVAKNPDIKIEFNNDDKERLLKSAYGLTKTEIENVFSRALILDKSFDVKDIDLILSEKKQIIKKSGVLEYYDAQEGMGDVGGLENLKEWIRKRTKAFSDDARRFGLPEPKGILLLGVQGCGKSLSAKAISSIWKLPLLKLDMGAIFGKYIGESENNIRKCIKTAESISPCILWVDELEKGFSGLSGSGDSGTTSRVFGSFLTWMQEKQKPVFIIATSNNVSALPPELLRKGRFDEIFFVDLPSKQERADIFKIHLKKRNKDIANFDFSLLSDKSQGYSGAEIEQAIISGLYDAYDESREITTQDLLQNIEKSVPLSVTMKEKITDLRQWAKDRAVLASKPDDNENIEEKNRRNEIG
jgi:AAA+ superfamily predicted ATPase